MVDVCLVYCFVLEQVFEDLYCYFLVEVVDCLGGRVVDYCEDVLGVVVYCLFGFVGVEDDLCVIEYYVNGQCCQQYDMQQFE